jgi:hypothetical protein
MRRLPQVLLLSLFSAFACANTQSTRAVPGALVLTPDSGTLFIGQQVQLLAVSAVTNNTSAHVPASEIVWTSEQPSAVTVDKNGVVTAVAATMGARIQANWSGLTATATFTVANAHLASLVLAPAQVYVTPTTTQALQVTGVLSDGTSLDLTAAVTGTTYSSSNTALATVSVAGVVSGVASGGPLTVTATNAGVSGTCTVKVTATPVTLSSLAVAPVALSLSVGTTGNLTATAAYSNGDMYDVTSSPGISWASSNTGAVTVSPQGLVTALQPAQAVAVTATYASVRGTSLVNAVSSTLTALALLPAQLTIPLHGTVPLQVIGTFQDGHTQDLTSDPQVLLTSAAPATASLSGTTVTGVAAGGPVTLTAQFDGLTATSTVTVLPVSLTGLTIAPATGTVPLRGALQLVVTGTLSDGSMMDLSAAASGTTYTVATTGTLSVDADGLAQGLAVGGPVAVTAANAGMQATAQLTVMAAPDQIVSLSITPASGSVDVMQTLDLVVTATYGSGQTGNVTSAASGTVYSVSAPALLSVSGDGVVTGLAYGGPVTVTAANGGASATSTLRVATPSPPLTSLVAAPSPVQGHAGATVQLTVIGHFEDGSAQDLTASSTGTTYAVSGNPAIASVSTDGAVQLLSAGSCAILITNGAAQTVVQVEVNARTLVLVKVSPTAVQMPVGFEEQLTVTGVFSDGSTADLTASSTGTVYSIVMGRFQQSTTVAKVSSEGLVTAIANGRAQIQVANSGVGVGVPVSVRDATVSSLAVSAASSSIPAGETTQLTCTATLSTGQLLLVTAGTTGTTWITGNPGVVTVDGNGLATGVAAGTATVSCLNHGKTASLSLTVTPAVAETVVVAPAAATLPLGEPLALDVTVTFSDGTTANASGAASGTVYVSSNLAEVSVSPDGVVQGLQAGTTATVTVLVAGQTQTCVITVVPAVLDAISFARPAPALAVGQSTVLTVHGTWTDGTSGVVTQANGLTFTTADGSVATVDALGNLMGVGSGQTIVYAYAAGLVAQETVTVQ